MALSYRTMAKPTERLSAALADRYQILRQLGEGGMATVYLAEDLKHKRKVAVKVLKAELAAVLGAERFVQEITTTASLQHPHILPLFDSGKTEGRTDGQSDSYLYYVMPYIEGETLRQKLDRETQLGIDEAVKITTEVADALDYAHRQGVIHRDIKPENILLHDGRPMVSDFGIALAVSAAAGGRMTETGLSLGTPHYMSPEQATAEKEITGRSDIYSLGSVLYEMLTGNPPHTGSSAQQIIMKIIAEDVAPVTKIRRSVPANVAAAVARSVEKLPADRFETAAEFAAALIDKNFRTSGTLVPERDSAEQQKWKRLAVIAGASSAVLLLLALWGWFRPGSPSPVATPSHLAMLTPGIGGTTGSAFRRHLTLTPDGEAVIYSRPEFGMEMGRLVRQPLDDVGGTPILLERPPGIGRDLDPWRDIHSPMLSPDGRWLLASTRDGHTYRFPARGGRGDQLDLQFPAGPFSAWAPDGALWVSPSVFSNVLMRLAEGDTLRLTVESTDPVRLQQVLPDGEHALVLTGGVGSTAGGAAVVDLRTGAIEPLLGALVSQILYTQNHLVYTAGGGTLFAAPFDPGKREVLGSPVAIANGVSVSTAGVAQFVVAPNGTVAYIPAEPRSLVLVDRAGALREATPERRDYHAPAFAPDGRRISVDFTTRDGRDIRVLDLVGGTMSRATFVEDGHDGRWTPDGQYLTYLHAEGEVMGIYRSRPGSIEPAESLFASPRVAYTGVWLRDGGALVTTGNEMNDGSLSDIGIITNRGRGPFEAIVASQFNEDQVTVSPDGQWLAFVSDQSGNAEVYLRRLDDASDQIQVSQSGGTEPVWSPKGGELFYRGSVDGGSMLMSATVQTSPVPAVTSREPLFSAETFVTSVLHPNYDVAPDGGHFIMIRESPGARVMVIQNLAALVRRRSGQGVP